MLLKNARFQFLLSQDKTFDRLNSKFNPSKEDLSAKPKTILWLLPRDQEVLRSVKKLVS